MAIKEKHYKEDFQLSLDEIKNLLPKVKHVIGDKNRAFMDESGVRRLYRTYALGAVSKKRKDFVEYLFKWIEGLAGAGVEKIIWHSLPKLTTQEIKGEEEQVRWLCSLYPSDKDGNEVHFDHKHPYDNSTLEMM